MYLAIYRKNNKLYFNTVKKLTETFYITNQNFDTVKLGYKNKIESYKFNNWDDFKKIKENLKKYGLRLYVAEVKSKTNTMIKFVCELMGNAFYNMAVKDTEEENDVDDNGSVRVVELWDKTDWEYAEEQFNFSDDFWKNIF
jgi:uncharacterized protein (DUF2164 family)